MAQPGQEQLRQAVVDEVAEMCIRLMRNGYTLREIEQAAYEHFERRVNSPKQESADNYLRRKFGI